MKPVLINTRPAPDGARFAALVRAQVDVAVVASPVLEIVPLDAVCPQVTPIFTSTNGVAQAARLGLSGGPAWCVGDRTAEVAREIGFEAISAHGTVEDLLRLILARDQSGPLVHVRGKEARGDLGPRLRAAGRDCADVIAYEQRPLAVSQVARAHIEGAELVIIPLFSPRSAALLCSDVVIGPNAIVLAMSNAVAKEVAGAPVQVIDAPTGDAMLAATIVQCLRLSRA